MEDKKVIDISQWQTVNNWQQLGEEVDGVILRLGYRGYETAKIVKDNKFDEFLKNVKKYNIPYGIYFVTQAITVDEAQQEAQYCLDQVKGGLVYPIFIDSENGDGEHASGRADRGKMNRTERTGILKAFCDYIQTNSQYTSGIYASENWFINELNAEKLDKYFLWVAKYSSNAPTIACDAWQYTSTGAVNAVNGSVDISHFYKIAKFYEIDEIAKEVLAGKWGNGAERKEKLKAAGYNYNTIQAKVNEMLAMPKKSNEDIAQEVLEGKWGNGADRKALLEAIGYNYDEIQAIVNQMAAATTKKSNEEVAKEVMAGLWGNGAERKEKLEESGYNYNEIQDIVNQMAAGQPRKSNEEVAKEVLAGLWGNGQKRKEKLEAAGYNYNEIQDIVYRLIDG